MGYQWGDHNKPTPALFDGQLYADDEKIVWCWSEAEKCWKRRPDLILREVARQDIKTINHGLGQSPFLASGVMYNDWSAYELGFVEVVNTQDPWQVFGRRAQLDQAALMEWFEQILPTNPEGTQYTVNVTVRVFEVVDPSIKPSKVYGWNEVYAALRGKHCYRSYRYRGGLPPNAGAAVYFQSYYHLPRALGTRLVQEFLGETPAVDDPNDTAIWTPSWKGSLFVFPKAGSGVGLGSNRRRAWDSTDKVWVDPPLVGFIVQNDGPMVAFVEHDGTAMDVSDARSVLKPNRIVRDGIQAILAYHVMGGGGRYHAFFCKPYGINHMSLRIGLDPAGWDLWAKNIHRAAPDVNNPRLKQVAFEDRGSDGLVFNAYSTLWPYERNPPKRTIRENDIPESVQMYVRQKMTGLRSECFDTTLQIVRHRHNAPLYLAHRRG
jgi:hypothetical protein